MSCVLEVRPEKNVRIGQVRVLRGDLYMYEAGAKFIVRDVFFKDAILISPAGAEHSLQIWWIEANTEAI